MEGNMCLLDIRENSAPGWLSSASNSNRILVTVNIVSIALLLASSAIQLANLKTHNASCITMDTLELMENRVTKIDRRVQLIEQRRDHVVNDVRETPGEYEFVAENDYDSDDDSDAFKSLQDANAKNFDNAQQLDTIANFDQTEEDTTTNVVDSRDTDTANIANRHGRAANVKNVQTAWLEELHESQNELVEHGGEEQTNKIQVTIERSQRKLARVQSELRSLRNKLQKSALQNIKTDQSAYGFEVTSPNGDVTQQRPKRRIKRQVTNQRHGHSSDRVGGAKKKRRRKSKRTKNLPAIQFEGHHSTRRIGTDKSDLSGLWVTALGVAVDGVYNADTVHETGTVRVLTDGVYILYAQVSLIGRRRKGFHIYQREVEHGVKAIATCKMEGVPRSVARETCFTLKLVRLEANTDLFIGEFPDNTGVHYLKDSTFFGLVKVGNVS